ncbi:hypothetical protein M1145_00805 [Patescibacteria group bacterium]|nr:hypothetical protein [Patescibacteria group bacterium]
MNDSEIENIPRQPNTPDTISFPVETIPSNRHDPEFDSYILELYQYMKQNDSELCALLDQCSDTIDGSRFFSFHIGAALVYKGLSNKASEEGYYLPQLTEDDIVSIWIKYKDLLENIESGIHRSEDYPSYYRREIKELIDKIRNDYPEFASQIDNIQNIGKDRFFPSFTIGGYFVFSILHSLDDSTEGQKLEQRPGISISNLIKKGYSRIDIFKALVTVNAHPSDRGLLVVNIERKLEEMKRERQQEELEMRQEFHIHR